MSDQDNSVKEGLFSGKKVNNLHHGLSPPPEERYFSEHEKFQDDIVVLRTYIYRLTAAAVVVVLLLVTIITVLFVKFGYDIVHHTHQPKVGEEIADILDKKELCVPCEDMRLGPSIEENLMLDKFNRKKDPGGEQCCVETPKQLLSLLQMFIERRYREELAKGNIKLPLTTGKLDYRPSAHLMGSITATDHAAIPGQQFSVSSWIADEDLAFLNQMSYRHGRIVVPSTGLYYIYSQVSFLEVFDFGRYPDVSTTSHSLSHYIYRYNIIYKLGGEELLIQNSMTKCWEEKRKFGEYSSYLGALFRLREGDEIFVKVSNLTMMIKDPKQNYFGIFKISDL